MRRIFLAILAFGLTSPAHSQTGPDAIRAFFDSYLLKDLAYFQSRFGVAEETRRDYWDQFRGLSAMSYTINGCSYEIIAERGRVISIGLYVQGDCDVSVNPDIFRVARASAIQPQSFADTSRWRFHRDCVATEGLCARYDDNGVIIAEPRTTLFRISLGAEGMPEISIEGEWRNSNGDPDMRASGAPDLYRESWGLYRNQ
jgi:hypothetical protein